MAVGGLTGCGDRQKEQSQAPKTTHKKAKTQKKQAKKVEVQATDSTNEQISEPETSNASSMDFAQIKQGNYSSLLGQWTQVAGYLNKQDGQGYAWETDHSLSLTVAQNKITYSNVSIQGSSLTDSNEEEARTLTFRENNGALLAQSNDTGIIWDLGFYPKGVAFSAKEWRPGIPTAVESSKDRLTVRSSSTGYVAVFQKNHGSENSQAATKKKEELNFEQIKAGNYSGLTGKWQNGQGKQLTVKDNQIDFSDVDNNNHTGQLSGLKLNIPAQNDAAGEPKDLPYFEGTAPAYQQNLTVENYTVGVLSLRSSLPGAVLYISFLLQGVAGDLQNLSQSELQRDKIIAVGTQNNATAVPKEYVYYRVE